jgi:hypothetical protein
VSALILVTWEVTRPLVGVTTWIRGDCRIINTMGKNFLASFTFKHYLSSIYYMSLAMFSISYMLVLLA